MKKRNDSGKIYTLPMLAVNIIIAFIIAAIFMMYSRDYNAKLNAENLSNIKNLNQSAATIADAYFNTQRESLANMVGYVESKDLTLDETLEYLIQSTSASGTMAIQIIASDYKGFAAEKDENGKNIAVTYEHDSYANLQKIFAPAVYSEGINCTPEFTDNITKKRCFALYQYINIASEDGENKTYTIIWVSKTDDVIDIINLDGGYLYMSTVLTDNDGDYILSHINFKTTNFFNQIRSDNDTRENPMTLEDINAIKAEFIRTGDGELYYKDKSGRDCVFRYAHILTNDWYCITAVPLSSFHSAALSSSYLLSVTISMFALLVMDVAWLFALNKRLRTSIEMEKQANTAKSEFLSRMSHDIRTPLNGIIGSTALALEEKNSPETVSYLKTIDSSGKFLLGLVNDVLDMSKVESGKISLTPEPYEISELREYLSAVIMPLAKSKDITFEINIEDNESAFNIDRLRFNQICFNLLSNSVKFTHPGGKIEFEMKESHNTAKSATLNIKIADNGIGMSEAFQSHMFESFSQEKRSFDATPGTGLGLAIVRNLITLMDGKMRVESKEDEGTTFYITLEVELCEAGSKKEKDINTPEEIGILNGKRVLLCEDNAINIMIAEKLLEKQGISVVTALNGNIGVTKFAESENEYYDAILMDVMMPELNGLDATREIRALNRPDAKTVPIIAMTANAYASDVNDCIAAGMDIHISKPVNPSLLYSTLAKYISERKKK